MLAFIERCVGLSFAITYFFTTLELRRPLPTDSYRGMNPVMPAPAAKLSISLPASLAKAVRKRVGARGLSGFFAQAAAHELERQQLGEFIAELTQIHGAPSKAALAAARRAWPKR
jgi:hypothetical protein